MKLKQYRPARPNDTGRRSRSVTIVLGPDALEAVARVMAENQCTQSSAVHHLVRLGANLPPLSFY
jgi:hypothetical protein